MRYAAVRQPDGSVFMLWRFNGVVHFVTYPPGSFGEDERLIFDEGVCWLELDDIAVPATPCQSTPR